MSDGRVINSRISLFCIKISLNFTRQIKIQNNKNKLCGQDIFNPTN